MDRIYPIWLAELCKMQKMNKLGWWRYLTERERFNNFQGVGLPRLVSSQWSEVKTAKCQIIIPRSRFLGKQNCDKYWATNCRWKLESIRLLSENQDLGRLLNLLQIGPFWGLPKPDFKLRLPIGQITSDMSNVSWDPANCPSTKGQ